MTYSPYGQAQAAGVIAQGVGIVPSRHPALEKLLTFFRYEHLPAKLREVSKPFGILAHQLADELPESAELTVAIRKLLESKDAAVRAAL